MSKFDWLASFRKGDISLADAIYFHLKESSAPPDILAAYDHAITRYAKGDIDDLAAPFGISMKKQERATTERWSLIKGIVDDISAGLQVVDRETDEMRNTISKAPKTSGTKDPETKTVFELAAETHPELMLSASRIEDIYYNKDSKKKKNKMKPLGKK